jgi:hypothetical protein
MSSGTRALKRRLREGTLSKKIPTKFGPRIAAQTVEREEPVALSVAVTGAFVPMLRVASVPDAVMVAGCVVQLDSLGRPEQLKFTVPVNPSLKFTVN